MTIRRSSDYYGPRGTGTTAGENIMKPASAASGRDGLARSTSPTRSTT